MLIDTHTHLYDSQYQDIQDDVIKEAYSDDVRKMIVVGVDKQTSLKSIELSNKYDFLYAAIGLHPSEVLKETDDDLKWMEQLVNNDKVIAIGEIGLDYYWDKSYNDKQKVMFKKQINIACKYKLPVIVHSRDAIADTFEILKNNQTNGVLHAFSSSVEMAREFVKLGYFIGVGGVVTFKNAKQLKEVVKDIPLNYIISETDCPYLSPVPYRGKINKPSYIRYVVDEISKIKFTNVEEVEKKIEENTNKLFKI